MKMVRVKAVDVKLMTYVKNVKMVSPSIYILYISTCLSSMTIKLALHLFPNQSRQCLKKLNVKGKKIPEHRNT